MEGTIRCVVLAGLLVGCPADDTVAPDDAPVAATGLIVEWTSSPESWPSDLGDGVTLERARFAIDSLRVIGDAGPGDPRTTATTFEARWDETSSPPDHRFEDAPPGLYSQVSLAIDGHLVDDSYELRGHVFVNGNDWEYRIEDQNPLGFYVTIDKTLAPGQSAIVRLRVNFLHALDAIDFSTLDVEDGHLSLEEGDLQMPTFRQKLVESFEIVSATAR